MVAKKISFPNGNLTHPHPSLAAVQIEAQICAEFGGSLDTDAPLAVHEAIHNRLAHAAALGDGVLRFAAVLNGMAQLLDKILFF